MSGRQRGRWEEMKVDGGVGRWVGGSVAIFIYTFQCIIFDKETCYLRVFKKAVAKLFIFI